MPKYFYECEKALAYWQENGGVIAIDGNAYAVWGAEEWVEYCDSVGDAANIRTTCQTALRSMPSLSSRTIEKLMAEVKE